MNECLLSRRDFIKNTSSVFLSTSAFGSGVFVSGCAPAAFTINSLKTLGFVASLWYAYNTMSRGEMTGEYIIEKFVEQNVLSFLPAWMAPVYQLTPSISWIFNKIYENFIDDIKEGKVTGEMLFGKNENKEKIFLEKVVTHPPEFSELYYNRVEANISNNSEKPLFATPAYRYRLPHARH